MWVDEINIEPGETSPRGFEGRACQEYFASFKGKLAACGVADREKTGVVIAVPRAHF